MKVMFVETVEGSGSRGDVKDVKPGYARNYLLPKGLAVPATPHAVERAEELRVAEAERAGDVSSVRSSGTRDLDVFVFV